MAHAIDAWAPLEIDASVTPPVDLKKLKPKARSAVCDLDASAPAATDEDDELLRRLAGNDEVAFRTLVSRHVDRAFSIALRILGSRADAEDVVQDTFLKVWIHRGRWEHGRAKFSTWLYRVVMNRSIDLHRRPRTENVDAIPEPMDSRPDAVSVLHRSEVTAMLEAAMAELPEQQRVAVILSYHESMSNAEIADVMDTTVAAVESLLKRARQQLKSMLRRKEGDIRHSFTD